MTLFNASTTHRHSKLGGLAVLAIVCLGLFELMRLVFLTHFGSLDLLRLPATHNSLYLGLKFDLRLVAILFAPPWLLLRTGRKPPKRRTLGSILLALTIATYLATLWIGMVDDSFGRWWLVAFLLLVGLYRFGTAEHGLDSGTEVRWIWTAYVAMAALFVLAAYATDFGSYAYNHERLNGTVLQFLENPLISGQMVWQTYPIGRGALAIVATLALLGWLIRTRQGWHALAFATGPRWAITGLVSVLLVAMLWGKESRYPLRWGEAFDGRDRFVAQLALNPVIFFLETRVVADAPPDLKLVRATHQALAQYFGVAARFDNDGQPSLLRTISPQPLVTGTPNLVFIQMESLAAHKTSMTGNPLNPTPFLKQLAAKSIYFENFYVVMENTSRSMFATLFGIADITAPKANATRNPLLVDQNCLLNGLSGYQKFYFLGGSANWAQIRAAIKNNVPDVQIFEEGSYHAPVVDVWGVADADLLREGGERLATVRAPYFAYFQTSGDHPPYTIPAHLADFHTVEVTEAQLSAAQFVSNEELNAVRLMDYSIEKFFAAQAASGADRNTVYLLWADHGIPRGNTDRRFAGVPLAVHHIPAMIYAPGLIQPRTVATVGSQLDILPTVMSLLGHTSQTQTLGKDLLDPQYATRGGAFTFSTWQRPPVLGFIQGSHYLVLEPDGGTHLYDLYAATEVDRAAQFPEKTQELRTLAQGFNAWSRYLMEHNKPPARP